MTSCVKYGQEKVESWPGCVVEDVVQRPKGEILRHTSAASRPPYHRQSRDLEVALSIQDHKMAKKGTESAVQYCETTY
jgi:hypothetical protein